MGFAHGINLQLASTIGAAVMALMVIGIRLRAAKKPTSVKKIIIPPIGMSTGFLMFLSPQTHVPPLYALIALLVGFLFSYPLIHTSKFEVVNGDIFLKRSKSFPLILLGLLAIRLLLHNYVEQYISLSQTGAVFFILAFGMILPWRVAMYLRYLKLKPLQKTR